MPVWKMCSQIESAAQGCSDGLAFDDGVALLHFEKRCLKEAITETGGKDGQSESQGDLQEVRKDVMAAGVWEDAKNRIERSQMEYIKTERDSPKIDRPCWNEFWIQAEKCNNDQDRSGGSQRIRGDEMPTAGISCR